MKLSEVLKSMNYSKYYELVREQNFETLGLVASKLDKSMCIFLDDIKFKQEISSNVTMVITKKDLANELDEYGLCIVEEPRILFFLIHNYLSKRPNYKRNSVKTIVGNSCRISKLACIAETNVVIGNNVIIEEFVSIKENTVIGDNSIIRTGTVLGGVDFEFKNVDNSIMGVEHCGGVILGNNVEIQHNSSVCKALYPWDNTIIGDNTKIDDLVQISHGVKIGENVMVVGQSGIGGRTTIGSNTWIGYSTTIKNGLKIGENCRVNMGSVVTQNVNDFESVTGNFAISHDKFIKFIKNINK